MQISAFIGRAVLASLCVAMCAQSATTLAETRGRASQHSAEVKPGETPPGLSTPEWSSIQTQIEQSGYRLESTEQGVSATNPKQGWTMDFDARGLSLDRTDDTATTGDSRSLRSDAHASDMRDTASPEGGRPMAAAADVSVSPPRSRRARPALQLRTTAIGRADALTPVTGATPAVRDNRVELHHAQATEWYVNSAMGLEHGYTFHSAPLGERGEVRIQLAVEGGLKAQADGDGVGLTDASGTQRMRYHKLVVVDANQQKLDARLQVDADDRLQIAFDDTQARYPVTVDPLLVNEEAKLTVAGDGTLGDNLGSSIAVDGDTMVVGRPDSAYVFVRSGTRWTQQQKLSAADGAGGDEFGYSVAVSGDTVVVGAHGDTLDPNFAQGSTYVFVRSGTSWVQQAKLVAADGSAFDHFGISVAVSGDTAVVGAHGDTLDTNYAQGSTYVFVRSGTSWVQQQKLAAADGAFYDQFGISVAVSGDTVVVGAHGHDPGANESQGSAYVFVRSGTSWEQQQKLVAADGAEREQFGRSVAVSGDTVVVGAYLGNFGASNVQGSAYVFVRIGTNWTQQQKLTAPDNAVDDQFGTSVAVSGDTVVVGAHHRDPFANIAQGSAYVFIRSGTNWTLQQKLVAADGAADDRFGFSVAVSGDTAVVGAPFDDLGARSDRGSAYVFARSAASWTQRQKLATTDGAAGDFFGYSVAVSGDTAVVGAHGDDLGANAEQGSAYVFVRSSTRWTQQQKLVAADGTRFGQFGFSVAVSGDTAVVGAHGDNLGANINQGSAYVFVRSGTSWTQQQKLIAADGAEGDRFGFSVAVSGGIAVVGAHGDDIGANGQQGSAYVFVRSGTSWTQQQKLVAADGSANDYFGYSVAVFGKTAIVGASQDEVVGNPHFFNSGSAYVFVRNGTRWAQQAKLVAADRTENDDHFGYSVAVSGNTAVVGTLISDVGVQAYVFVRNGTRWKQQHKLVTTDGTPNDSFGYTVAVSGNTAVVGAHKDDSDANPLSDQGSAYVFVRSGTSWTQQRKLVAADGAADDEFGISVAVSGDTVVVGAHLDDNPSGGDAGAAYVYRIAAGSPGGESFQVQNVRAPGKCLQPEDGSPSAGDLMSAKTCDASSAAQALRFPLTREGSFRMTIGDLCIGTVTGNFNNGARLQLQACTGNSNQNFAISGTRFAAANAPNQVMDLHAGNLNDVIFWEDFFNTNQQWNPLSIGTAPPPPTR